MMVSRSTVLIICVLSMASMTIDAFDSTEIRLLEWPRGASKTFTKRNDILETGLIGPIARFRKNGQGMIRNVSRFQALTQHICTV